MSNKAAGLPVVLELAALPRDQVGPFLLLGVDKTADKTQIEAGWAKRLIWARKNVIATPLEDINWARDILNDQDKRVRADAGFLNVDTTGGLLRHLQDRYATGGGAGRLLDIEKSLAAYTPATALPDLDEIRSAIPAAEVPADFPAVPRILEQLVQDPLDPWDDAVTRIGQA